ncbi:FAD-binding protein [Puerhibacterium sp. TATVAM-FAB25]|uniref:FAD-binding protein n=1 Tax=Puerhibacterium sp. TATVAM-FAB25 TaxID=3093699 RepID=UPI003979BDFC
MAENPTPGPVPGTEPGENWSRSLAYTARELVAPRTVEELRQVVLAADRVHVVGSRHSFSPVADTDGVLVDVTALPTSIIVDAEARTVTVSAGVRHAALAEALHAQGWALRNLASLPHISVAGAVATGTHGSGTRTGSLATQVAGLRVLTGEGEVVELGREEAAAAAVHLGALGVVLDVTLDVVPTFEVRQQVFDGVRWDAVGDDPSGLLGSAYSVSVFTDWAGDGPQQVFVKAASAEELAAAGEVLAAAGGTPVTERRHPILGLPAEAANEQGGVPGPWHARLPHFRADHTPSAGEEIQSEYLLPGDRVAEAVKAMRGLSDVVTPLLQVAELRSVAADEAWASPTSRALADGGSADWFVGFHFTWVKDAAAVGRALPAVEEALLPLGARPHWGKVFTPDLPAADLYPRIGHLRELAERLDPRRRFVNAFLERHGVR